MTKLFIQKWMLRSVAHCKESCCRLAINLKVYCLHKIKIPSV
ncbi:MAG: hypothetical protein QMD50_03475 [Patescibacteria group bacterium]|nr:hypothetical protein [Patescibacteria group bacterium]